MRTNVKDVAKYVLEKHGPMSTMKLQKLVYYCHAYKLGWTREPMFSEKVRAWENGPVVYELFKEHQGKFEVSDEDISGDAGRIVGRDRIIVDQVLASLGGLTGWELRNRTHEEAPWDDAFDPDDERHNTEITPNAMSAYYR